MAQDLLDLDKLNRTILCYAETVYRINGVWEGPDPLTPFIPLFFIQITLAIMFTRLLVFALKPFNQPSIIAEILSGIILGPSVFGRNSGFRKLMFPSYTYKVLEPMAHLALVYHAFLVGLRMDIKAIRRTGSKALNIAVAGTIIPFSLGSTLYFVFRGNKTGFIFWGAALTVTGFSVLAEILEKQEIINTEIGKTAMASALINEVCAWCFLALGLAITGAPRNIHWSLLCTIVFVLLSVYYIRPFLNWVIRKTPEGQGYSEFYICSVLTGVAFSGVITDACGTHPMIGAFVFGLVIPSEVLEAALIERLEDFVAGIFMPVFFMVCGLRTNVDTVSDQTSWIVVAFVLILACTAKILCALAVSLFSNIPAKEAVAVGVLTNTKGAMAMIILEAGQTQLALNTQTYSLMVIAILLMTMVVMPATITYRPSKNLVPYKRRTIEKAKSDEELRVLACIYNTRHVPSIINLLRASNATNRSPIRVFALQLVELIGRATASLVVHSNRKVGPRNPSDVEAQADHIISAFDNYELRSDGVTTQALTARCAYSTMDEDICNVAKDKRSAFIIIPFHKQQTLDGEMEDINPAIRSVNEGVLENAPCSVGILIDRGLQESNDHARNIAMLYFGGPDDREALSYAWRMAENSNITLTVARFTPSSDAEELDPVESVAKTHMTLQIDSERENLLDEDYLNKFKIATANDKSITYVELMLNDEEETVNAIKSMDKRHHDLYIVGKGAGIMSPLTTGLADWCDCPELGPIGDLLVTSEFESAFSVLVVQQYIRSNKRDGSERSASSVDYGQEMELRPSVSGSDGFESITSFTTRDQNNRMPLHD
ncbi:cation H(+) antiporter 15-like [Olea europaea subsp. europaea]|uniref:Cation H(+) antiporter 15-like n=2 Tax=Olea europaea subsp. europaea TaxID=158383 RepID=A0A8S0V8V7_OLEEU|nr:cation H(+) antiporter 15-like [Olea europaea subsp. europaea]